MPETVAAGLRRVRADEAEAYKREIEALRAQTDQQVRTAQDQAETGQQVSRQLSGAVPVRLHARLEGRTRTLPVSRFTTTTLTSIKSAAHEKPTLCVKSKTFNLINFQFESGGYIAPKILDNGYLAVGKKKLTFSRQGPLFERRSRGTNRSKKDPLPPGPCAEKRPIVASHRPGLVDGQSDCVAIGGKPQSAVKSSNTIVPAQAPLEINDMRRLIFNFRTVSRNCSASSLSPKAPSRNRPVCSGICPRTPAWSAIERVGQSITGTRRRCHSI